jgi:hypothetical protein
MDALMSMTKEQFMEKEESEEELCWCKVGIKECDCDKCGRCGCYECVSGGHGENEDENWCEECEAEEYPTCGECKVEKCLDYDDRLCHSCYHKSCGAGECWCSKN